VIQTPSVSRRAGQGSGSLSIEAARTNPRLTIYAVEQKEEELENIKKNIVKFRCFNIDNEISRNHCSANIYFS
jgi:precorrin-6Y C5,15-methyltransferase (decarboxylating)